MDDSRRNCLLPQGIRPPSDRRVEVGLVPATPTSSSSDGLIASLDEVDAARRSSIGEGMKTQEDKDTVRNMIGIMEGNRDMREDVSKELDNARNEDGEDGSLGMEKDCEDEREDEESSEFSESDGESESNDGEEERIIGRLMQAGVQSVAKRAVLEEQSLMGMRLMTKEIVDGSKKKERRELAFQRMVSQI